MGISQARILEWVAISFSRGTSQPRDRTRVSCTAGGFLIVWATESAYEEPDTGTYKFISFQEAVNGEHKLSPKLEGPILLSFAGLENST